jgi:hypothetical protein
MREMHARTECEEDDRRYKCSKKYKTMVEEDRNGQQIDDFTSSLA